MRDLQQPVVLDVEEQRQVARRRRTHDDDVRAPPGREPRRQAGVVAQRPRLRVVGAAGDGAGVEVAQAVEERGVEAQLRRGRVERAARVPRVAAVGDQHGRWLDGAGGREFAAERERLAPDPGGDAERGRAVGHRADGAPVHRRWCREVGGRVAGEVRAQRRSFAGGGGILRHERGCRERERRERGRWRAARRVGPGSGTAPAEGWCGHGGLPRVGSPPAYTAVGACSSCPS